MVLVNGRRRVNRKVLNISLFELICLPLSVLSIRIRINDEENQKSLLGRPAFDCRVVEQRFPDVPITINQVISDYELALMESVPEVFNGVEAKGCWFHYTQAIIKTAAQLGFNRFYRAGGVVALGCSIFTFIFITQGL